ncbi:MAG: YaaA family protein [Microbacter sp.]
MVLLLSPSKTMDFNRTEWFSTATLPLFEQEAKMLMRQLQTFSLQDLIQREHLSMKLAMTVFDWHQRFFGSDQRQKQALAAFHGTAFEQLDAATLTLEQQQFANDHLLIFSALYGLLRPFDLIRPYRLDMKSALLPSLYAFWQERVNDMLEQVLSQWGSPLINLASNEYAQLIHRERIGAHHAIITPVFKQERRGKLVTNSLYAKQARGLMARFIIEHQLTDAESLQSFMGQGYVFMPELSSSNEWVFVRY